MPDALSRTFFNATDTNEQKFGYQVHVVLDNLPVSKEKLDEIKQATRNEYVLQKLSSIVVEGWPETKETLPPELHAYFVVEGWPETKETLPPELHAYFSISA